VLADNARAVSQAKVEEAGGSFETEGSLLIDDEEEPVEQKRDFDDIIFPPAPEASFRSKCVMWLQDNIMGEAEPVHCQQAAWMIVSMSESTIALLCDSESLELRNATDAAINLWGPMLSAHSTIDSLLPSNEQAHFLIRAMNVHNQPPLNQAYLQEGIPGVSCHDIGILTFVDQTGSDFRAVLRTMHLPAEPLLGKDASILCVVEPSDISKNQLGKSVRRRWKRQGGVASGVSDMSVSSLSVTPDQSASQIGKATADSD